MKEYVGIKKEFENLDKKNNELQNLSFQIKKLEEDYQKIKELETLIDKESKIKKEINLIQEEIALKQIKSAKILSMELDNLKQELNNNQEYFKNKDINVKNLSITYEKNYHEYLSSQAGILALNLKEDMPCPVCGSLKHPNKAKTSLDIVSQEDLNNLKETLENEKNILNDLSKNCSILIENINTKEKNYLNFVKENNIKNDDIKEIKTDKTFEELLEEILNKKDILSKLNNELIEQNTKLELIKKDLKNKNIDDIDKNYQESVKKQENLIKEINSTKENHENKTIAIEQNNSKLELIKTQLIEYKNIETKEDNLSNKIEENIIKKEQIEKINKELLIKTTLNKKILENIKKQYQIFEKTSQDYTQYKILSDCANGNLKGSKRIAFEQYIQAYYLDMVILEANKRLKIMSKNQYQLQRKKEAQNYQSKTGLDIEVMDFHTFKTRSTKTLSGGESFIAALALALGLSDCISKMSGMINLDAIFIDEGFGSLDSDSLELAMDVISNLSETNKLIGIISHVQDLKNRIQNQIISIKTNSGSKIKLTF